MFAFYPATDQWSTAHYTACTTFTYTHILSLCCALEFGVHEVQVKESDYFKICKELGELTTAAKEVNIV